MLNAILLAVQFLTRLPVSTPLTVEPSRLGYSLLFYPLVGLFIGLLLCAVYLTLDSFASSSVLAAIILCLWVIITGGLHLDGLADSADAWAGGLNDPDKSLDIMKDPHCGPLAVVTISLTLLLKYTALDFLIAEQLWQILILAPVLGRTAIVALFLTTPYVRVGGIGETLAATLPISSAKFLIIAILLIALFFPKGLGIIIASVAIFYITRRLMLNRIAGTTGDTAGAMVELVEMTALVALALFS